MTIPNHPLIASVKPLLKATGAELVAPDALIAGDISLVWEGVTIAGVRTIVAWHRPRKFNQQTNGMEQQPL